MGCFSGFFYRLKELFAAILLVVMVTIRYLQKKASLQIRESEIRILTFKFMIMKYLLPLFLFSVSIGSCRLAVDSGKEIISVSIPPQKYLINKIAGDLYYVNVLVPPGASPETYEISPSQMKMLEESRVFLITGHLAFEDIWKRKYARYGNQNTIADLSEGIDLITTEYDHGDHSHYGADPHIWVSPKTMKILAENTLKALCEVYPDNSILFTAGYHELLQEINQADSILAELFDQLVNRSFLIFHPALGYLARDYELEQIPVEFEGKTPPPAYMQKIVNIAREKKLHSIFIQKEFSIENARAIAREINGSIIQIDPLDENWYDQILFIGHKLKELDNQL